ncbi:MAG: SGNH/GDSL hydrolase family protein [Clostridia bacterium]|nr:SGNH/GDSL hydrolase family protein [Clostridia bacterium]
MKILFFGDSITDANRIREYDDMIYSYGCGYPSFVAAELQSKFPGEYEIINRGNSGNRIVDLYARIKSDVWNQKPDVLSILIGINDIWHEVGNQNGVDLERYEKMYDILLNDTKKVLPNTKLIVCEPFVLKGTATETWTTEIELVKEYAAAAKRVAEKYGAYYLPLQAMLDKAAAASKGEYFLSDGVHPTAAGAKLIADEWLKLFNDNIR